MKFSSEIESGNSERNERQKIEFKGLREKSGQRERVERGEECGRSEGVEREMKRFQRRYEREGENRY